MAAIEGITLALGCDHAGYPYKDEIKAYLRSLGVEVLDMGTDSAASVDYPAYAKAVCGKVLSGEAACGVLICGSGIGMAMAANKMRGIRCAVCSEPYSARLTKRHNNCNVLAFGSRVVGMEVAKMMLYEWLAADYDPRHQRRLDLLTAIENEQAAKAD